jgi:hypothetical protein
MYDTTLAPVANTDLKKPPSRKARYFFVVLAILFPLIVLLGFFPSWRDMKAGGLEVHWLTHVHAAIMTSWILVFLLQALFATAGQLKYHRQLGLLSIGLGGLVFIAMGAVTVHILIVNHPPEESFLFDLLLTAGFDMAKFGLFFIWGIWLRKKDAAAHKRLLTLATFVLLIAAVDRVYRTYGLPSLGMEYPDVTFVYLDLLLIPLFLYDLITIKRIHRITWIGSLIVIVLQFGVSMTWGSPSWHKFWFRVTAPLMEQVVEVHLSDAQSDPLLGDYESTFGLLTFSRDNGKLFVQFGGQSKVEIGARSETELFVKNETMNFHFVLGPDRNVTAATLKMIGRNYPMIKLTK